MTTTNCGWSSQTVQLDMKINHRIYMIIGKGEAYTASCKQKSNTNTEPALVALDDVMWQIQW